MTLKAIQDAWIENPSDVETAARMFRDNLAAAGFAVVPVEPTEEMVNKGADETDPTWGYPDSSVGKDWAKAVWKAMIRAAQGGE